MGEARLELADRAPQCPFGFNAELLSQSDENEEQISELIFDGVRVTTLDGSLQLLPFLADLGAGSVEVGPVEAHGRRLVLEPPGTLQRGQGPRDARERIRNGWGRFSILAILARRRALEGCVCTFGGFEGRPLTTDLFGAGRRVSLGPSEDVRMPSDHLGANALDDPFEVEVSFALSKRRVKDNLEQEVAELLAVLGGVVERLEDFVGLLDEVGAQARKGLFSVPGAAVVREEAVHEVPEPVEPLAESVRGRVEGGTSRGLCGARGRLGRSIFVVVSGAGHRC